MLPPDRDRGDFDLMQRLMLSKPRPPLLARLREQRSYRITRFYLRRFWRWC